MDAKENQNLVSEETTKVEDGLSLKDVFGIIYKNLIVILIILVVAVGAGLGIALNQKPTYTAKKDVIVKCSVTTGSTSEYNNYSLSKLVLPDIARIALTNSVIENTAKTNYNKTGGNGQLTIANADVIYTEDSLFLTFTYTDATPEKAENKLEAFYEACRTEICPVNTNSPFFKWEVEFQEMTEGATSIQVNSSKMKTVIIAGVIGVVVAALFVVIRTLLDDTVTSKEELERVTGVKLFAYIDEITADEMKGRKAKKSYGEDKDVRSDK